MPIAPEEHDGITGVTFTSDRHRLLGTLYLARGSEPKPTALLLHGCPGLQQNGDLGPLLVVHGTADRWVPVAQARELVTGWLDEIHV
jgi:hypothetical protein